MLLVLDEGPHVHSPIGTPESSLPVPPVSLPQTNVSLACLQEGLAFTVALAAKPMPLVQVAIVKVAPSKSFTTVLSPFALILVISRIRAILGNEATLSLSHADSTGVLRFAIDLR